MTKKELLEWYSSIQSEKMPQYIEIDDVNSNQLIMNGKGKNIVFVWSLLYDGSKWKYVETDSERGYIFDLKSFNTEISAVEYAKKILKQKHLAIKENSKTEMLCRFIQQKFGYSEKRANIMISKIAIYNDIFEEFFNYARVGKFCKKDNTQTEVHGYTAEELNRDYNLSPLGAYNYLIYLRDNPEEALAYLKEGLPVKDVSIFNKEPSEENLADRGKLIKTMELPNNIRKLSEKERGQLKK